ncbi:/ rsuA / Ribosomal small subunit pseudouridine synthase A /:192862 Forward [Candidatus Hepatoplasma crinochetorum]|uniref:Pseudouridine synthase n=1 Tax=Candidatus Hepatoplasma crinochetorum TaxID=295596 RepID=A0A0G7ZNJ1_9MOLU|nr:/ rsuA / Ribosomal small subunit pseudouridine synthase A /:192862 Forward [Candidatus Hepatoplasma crinochetorum]
MNYKKAERIQKLIANYGNYSRREVEKLIKEKKVFKNKELVKLGDLATIEDTIVINNQKIKFNLKYDYFLLNKPKGYICNRIDQKNRSVISLINNYKNRNLFTIGRLDVNTTGLIIVTNDGNLKKLVESPASKIKKVYLVWLQKKINSNDLKSLIKGVELEDGYITKPIEKIKIISNDENILIKLSITEGKKNQIKRMFEALDNRVINLKRVQIGQLKLGSIKIKEYSKINKQEIYKMLAIKIN